MQVGCSHVRALPWTGSPAAYFASSHPAGWSAKLMAGPHAALTLCLSLSLSLSLSPAPTLSLSLTLTRSARRAARRDHARSRGQAG
eukprot:scaffold79937_cov45-Phaeocystis_antarctica.AAC.1